MAERAGGAIRVLAVPASTAKDENDFSVLTKDFGADRAVCVNNSPLMLAQLVIYAAAPAHSASVSNASNGNLFPGAIVLRFPRTILTEQAKLAECP